MKRIKLIILLGFISTYIYGQKFETNIAVSSLISFETSEMTESKIVFGFSSSVQEFYNITDNFAIGSEVNYSFENYKLKNNLYVSSSPELPYYESKLAIHAFSIPLILRLKTNSDWFINIGYGLSYPIKSKTSTDLVYPENNTRIEVLPKPDKLEHNLSSYYSLGIGKEFKLNDLKILTEIYYTHRFVEYYFRHGGGISEVLFVYKVEPQMIGIKIGVEI